MTTAQHPPNNGWADRITFTGGPEPIAYRPRDVIVPTEYVDPTIELARAMFERPDHQQLDLRVRPLGRGERSGRANPLARFAVVNGVPDPLLVVRELRSQGVDAQLNHVFFAHCGECCGPHPSRRAAGCGVQGSPVYATPVYATPVYATPVYATPVYATPVYATPVYATGAAQLTGVRRSSVQPVTSAEASDMIARLDGVPAATLGSGPIDVMVLDVGNAEAPFRGTMLGAVDAMSAADNVPDSDNDDHIDPVAGHGEFIEGLIKSIAPTARVAVRKVIEPEGDGDEGTIADAITALPDVRDSGGAVLSLSFGGYVLDDKAVVMGIAIRDAQARGWVVVASAGNDAICRRTYPAAFPDVIGVGAIGPNGPAPFTNYGPWVRACAPGVDLVSTYFIDYAKDKDLGPMTGWARWSGTSFSAPIVVGTIVAQRIASGSSDMTAAAARVVDAPELLRLEGLGTVVNRI